MSQKPSERNQYLESSWCVARIRVWQDALAQATRAIAQQLAAWVPTWRQEPLRLAGIAMLVAVVTNLICVALRGTSLTIGGIVIRLVWGCWGVLAIDSPGEWRVVRHTSTMMRWLTKEPPR